MLDIGVMRRSRPDPSLLELCQIDDKVLCDFVDRFRESISKSIQKNISFEDDARSWLLWKGLCRRFHKLKDLQNLEEKVARLKKHLEVDDDEPPVILVSPMYLNLLVINDQEV